MLIDLLSQTLERSGALENFWGKLDAGADATIGVASSARPFLVAARFAERPQPTLVVVPGEETAETFARMLGAYVGDEKVYLYREHEENPFILDPPANAKEYQARARQSARRLEALWALQSGRSCLVVASARALLRKVAPTRAEVARPLVLEAGKELDEMGISGVEDYEGLVERLVELGYENTGKLDGPGTFSAQGGTIDVFAGNLVNPVRLDFFGDELEEDPQLASRNRADHLFARVGRDLSRARISYHFARYRSGAFAVGAAVEHHAALSRPARCARTDRDIHAAGALALCVRRA